MCDRKTVKGRTCTKASDFMVHVAVEPQLLTLPDGSAEMESSPAGRMVTVCAVHLVQAVRELYALPIRLSWARVQVRPLAGR